MWVCAASSIRATTDAWRNTLLEFEAHPECAEGAFHVFDRKLKECCRYTDLKKTLKLWTSEPYTSVTRLLVLSGILSSVAFLAVTIMSALGCIVAVTGQP
jgi:hypothetical protein